MKLNVELRFWEIKDAEFVIRVRNTPELQRWFRQDADLTLEEQLEFMSMTAPEISYYGFIAEINGMPIGIAALRLCPDKSAEFCIGILPQWQGKGYTAQAVERILSVAYNEFQCKRVWGDVFVDNPALSFYLTKCGFKATSVIEHFCYKQAVGNISAVHIEQTK